MKFKRDELKNKLMNGVEVCWVYGEAERNRIFRGLDDILDGGFVEETNGDPVTQYDYDRAVEENSELAEDCADDIGKIFNIIADISYGWRRIEEEEADYLMGWLETWGVDIED